MSRMEKEDTKRKQCVECQHELNLGVEAVTLEYVVIGPRGQVPLRETKIFCDEDCLQRFLSNEESEHLPRRIP